jgi:branched-chain amino acid transport system substrate-binding protein
MTRRHFLQLSAVTGGALVFVDLIDQGLRLVGRSRTAAADEPIKIGMLDPLSSPYSTSSIHDIHAPMWPWICSTRREVSWDDRW